MEQLYNYLPRELVTFILVTLFSLLIGLSQRRISLKRRFSVQTVLLLLSVYWDICFIFLIKQICVSLWGAV